ncbi:hypothetical protein [Nonomuraea sp. NPDC050691]|uniref:hypothetical protein n=1 Tax=Nonomuraea sp. NPDC050691 TaxID=3155661 RepID=UPI0033CEA8AB
MNATEPARTATRRERLRAHGAASTSLALMGDRRLGELVNTATPAGSGIGGASARLEIEGVPVFVKRVPLTDLELLPANRGSTANLLGLPQRESRTTPYPLEEIRGVWARCGLG